MAESERIEVTRHRRPQDNPCTLAHRGRPESISLIVSSYNQPRSLALVLDALTRQSWRADEIIIADDGSQPWGGAGGVDRAAVIEVAPPRAGGSDHAVDNAAAAATATDRAAAATSRSTACLPM